MCIVILILIVVYKHTTTVITTVTTTTTLPHLASFPVHAELFVTYSTEKHSSCNQKQRRPGNKAIPE